MNRKALVLAGIAIFSIAAASQQGFVLRREVKENSTEVYSVKTEVKQTVAVASMGEQDLGITSSMKMTLKTGRVDAAKGEADVESIISDLKTEAEGMAAMLTDQVAENTPKEIKSAGKLDARNRVKLAAGKGMGMMEMLMGGSGPTSSLMFVEFPEKEIKVGDEWTITVPKSPMYGNKEQSLTAKLSGEKDHEGVKVWVINVTGKIKIDGDLKELSKGMANSPVAGQSGSIKGDLDLTGEALVDKTSGKTVLYTTNSKTKNVIDLTDMGMSVDTSGTVKTTMTLQKS